jgi:hypothetical protein
MPHSYEELRSVAVDILAGRESVEHDPSQYEHLKIGIAEVLARRAGQPRDARPRNLDRADSDLYLEVFWDLFRQGVITLGSNDANRDFPHCRVSELGKRILANPRSYFFHDVTSYTNVIKKEIPSIDPITLLYLQEAMQAFKAECLLSSTVMLGVAAEHTFLLLMDTIEANPKHEPTFKKALSERTLLQKANRFKTVLDSQITSLPPGLREDLDTHFAGILSVIRTFRNQSGHPTGQVMDREQVYVLLHLYVSYCKKLQQLREHFAQP